MKEIISLDTQSLDVPADSATTSQHYPYSYLSRGNIRNLFGFLFRHINPQKIETRTNPSIANRLPEVQNLKFTHIGKNLVTRFGSLVNLLINRRLHSIFRTNKHWIKRYIFRYQNGTYTGHLDKVPFAILNGCYHDKECILKNRAISRHMISDALEFTTHDCVLLCLALKDVRRWSFCATDAVPVDVKAFVNDSWSIFGNNFICSLLKGLGSLCLRVSVVATFPLPSLSCE